MNTDKTSPAATAPAQDFTACPHWGQGGSYVVDPATGLRTRVGDEPAQTGEAAAAVVPETSPAVIADSMAPIKSKEKARG